jgi:hypothetical protein
MPQQRNRIENFFLSSSRLIFRAIFSSMMHDSGVKKNLTLCRKTVFSNSSYAKPPGISKPLSRSIKLKIKGFSAYFESENGGKQGGYTDS